MIYFIRHKGSDGPIKIGTTRNLRARIISLRAEYNIEPEVLASGPGTSLTERQIHRLLHIHRAYGEWFHATPEVLSVACAVARQSQRPIQPDEVRAVLRGGRPHKRHPRRRLNPTPPVHFVFPVLPVMTLERVIRQPTEP